MCFYRAATVKCSNVSGGLFVYPCIFYFRRSCGFEDALNRLGKSLKATIIASFSYNSFK